MNELYLSKGYYNLCMAILKQAKKDAKSKKNKYDVDWFFNNSYVFDLCKNYIELYRNKEVKLYKLKKRIFKGLIMLVKKIVKGKRIIYRKAGFLDWFQKNEDEICVVFGAVTVIACAVLSLFWG